MPVVTGKYGPLVGAIDEGTSSARFLVSNKFHTFSEKTLW
jgi:glycerol kinase